MNAPRTHRMRSLRIAGPLISLGLLVQAATLFFTGPLSFMTFLFLGGGLAGAGVFLAVWTLRAGDLPETDRPRASADT